MKKIKREAAELQEMIRIESMNALDKEKDELYKACISYQESQIDVNLSGEMDKSEIAVETGALNVDALPMAAANGIWKEDLWLHADAGYYAKVAKLEAGQDYTRTFSDHGGIPHSFAEIRTERKAALYV